MNKIIVREDTEKVDKIIAELAIKYDISIVEVRRIVRHQFIFTSEKIADLDTKGVRLMYFGTFDMKPKIKTKLKLHIK
jgi:hypothetical protein